MKPSLYSCAALAAALCAAAMGCLAQADPAPPPHTLPAQEALGHLTVDVAHPGVKISPTLYGLMTEEINHSYDGGLYAELIQNRIFKDSGDTTTHWSLVQSGGTGAIALDNDHPVNSSLTTCLKLTIEEESADQRANGPAAPLSVGVANDGFWGIPVKPNTRYRASFYARADDGFKGPLTVDIESADGAATYASGSVGEVTGEWRKYAVELKTGTVAPSVNNRFVIRSSMPGTVYLNLVSLFPPTYNNRPNGNRIDLMQKLADLHPSFLRLPGGNYLEGYSITTRFDWRRTVHGLDQRPGHQGPWGYRSSDGLGLLEYLEWCEDLHMQPLLAVFAGFAGNEHVDPGPNLQPFVQEGLDEIEYATGGVNTPCGAQRAADGHPSPFNIKFIEVGNEDFFDRSGSYDGRFAQFYDAIKAKYPELQVIATTKVRSRRPDLIDDHYYSSSVSMEQSLSHHYDGYLRTDPKVFVGEWATTEGSPTPNLRAALADAAFLTGLERNSDVVVMSSYAPLLVNVNQGARQWATNLIGYDALTSFCSPSYYVQKIFNENRGDVELPVTVTPEPVQTTYAPFTGGVGVGTWRTEAEFKGLNVSSSSEPNQPGTTIPTDTTTGWTFGQGDWSSQDGSLSQSGQFDGTMATAGNSTWTDYSYHLQARKVSGDEGFLILFHVKDKNNYMQWNLGGWGNSRTRLQATVNGNGMEFGDNAPVTIETGRWYDIRIDLSGHDIRCYLDGKLITQASDLDTERVDPLYVGSSRDLATGDIILKVTNVDAKPQNLQIDLHGARQIKTVARGSVMSGEPDGFNSIARPTNIVPTAITLTNAGTSFIHAFPAYSVTVIRLKTK